MGAATYYGIPKKYITYMQKTDDKCACRVFHNEVLSELIEMLRQGCLLPLFRFLLVTDWMSRQTTESKGNVSDPTDASVKMLDDVSINFRNLLCRSLQMKQGTGGTKVVKKKETRHETKPHLRHHF